MVFSIHLVWITGCGSASLKLCVCSAASPWSQSPSLDSQCKVSCGRVFFLIFNAIWPISIKSWIYPFQAVMLLCIMLIPSIGCITNVGGVKAAVGHDSVLGQQGKGASLL